MLAMYAATGIENSQYYYYTPTAKAKRKTVLPNSPEVPELFLSWFETDMKFGVSVSSDVSHPDIESSISQ